jgi:pimeloyl-ACP methyl ester carboxylesterase
MSIFKYSCVAGAVSLLAACGGGDTSFTISGLAANGAALANAPVSAKCVGGAAVAGKTGGDGSFSLTIPGVTSDSCMIQAVSGGTTLHSFATGTGNVNVTPLTELVLTKALGTESSAAFAAFDSAKAGMINAGLASAKTYVRSEITALTGSAPSGDLLTGVFKVGDADDKVLDSLQAKLAVSKRSLSDLRQGAVSGQPFSTATNRGTLIGAAQTLVTLTAAQIDAATASSGLQAISGKAKCDVSIVALNYNTIGVQGEAANASGVMLVPSGTGQGCTSAEPLLAYARGTEVSKVRTLANPADGETFLLSAVYAAQGYAVVATDYLGYAKSTYAYHPYLHADSQASVIIDSIRAARNAASTTGAALSGKVMLSGYSQGGHASMSAHRAIERDNAAEINVVGGAHLAGPYNLSGSLKVPDAVAGVQFFVPLLVTAWQKVYGTAYTDVKAVFKAPYSDYIESLLPSATLTYTTLVTSGQLPGAKGETPNQARDAVFQSAFLADTLTNSNNGVYLAAKKNDVTGWSPKSKTLLCGGAGDPTVPPAVHQKVAKADFDSRGLTNVSSVDVDPYIQATYGVAGKAPTDPTSAAFGAYYSSYHGSYEPPFCNAQAKAFFDQVK